MMRRWLRPALFCAMAGLPGVAAGVTDEPAAPQPGLFERLRDEGRLTLAVRSEYFSSSRSLDDETGLLGAAVEGRVRLELAAGVEAVVDARLHDPELGGSGSLDSVLRDGYLSLHNDRLDVRLGRQIVAWGRADGLNPTDNLTPRDYTVLLPYEDDQRFGTTALRADWTLSESLTVTAFTTPYFQPSVVPLPAGYVYLDSRPPRTLADSELALRLNRAGGEVDWSASYFHGYSLLPDGTSAGSVGGVPAVALHYDAIDVLGGDVATNVGRYGLRAEIAYTWTDDPDGADPTVKNPFLYYVAGIDRTFGESLNINFQALGIHVRSWSDPESIADPVLRAVAVQNAIIDRQQRAATYGATLRISHRWLNDALSAELLAVHYVDPASTYVRPLVSYALTDHFKLAVGGEWYEGDPNSFFGYLRDNRGVFLELRWNY